MLTKTTDAQLIKSILSHPSIWWHIAPKHVNADEFDLPMEADYYLTPDNSGVIILHELALGVQIHVNILPGNRGEPALLATLEAVNMGLKSRDIVYATIPTECANVYQFALKCGMTDGGMLNGKHFVFTHTKLGA